MRSKIVSSNKALDLS